MKKLQHLMDKLFPEVFPVEQTPIFLFDTKRILNFIIPFLQFIGILLIINLFKIEKSSGLIQYSYPILICYLIYSFTTVRYKHPVLLVGMASIILNAFGVKAGLALISIGIILITICHLKTKHWIKLSLIFSIFLVFAIGKTDLFYSPRLNILISYLMPMFMFRIIIYLYELKHGLIIKSFWQSITYFFLLPNIFFLFFPIIDYKTYLRTYYNASEKDIWQKGIRWMLRGIFHLLAYRVICYYYLSSNIDVKDLSSLLIYLLTNYLLIIRLSGIFHFIIGLLCMFGMNLPKVFDNYFIATSFVDLWRRINIYWRDFILKIFFYPIMFSYKKRIKTYLLPTTMMTVFLITCLLHTYQLFWITGSFSLKTVDLVFWITVGILITINSMLIEKGSNKEKIIESNSKFKIYLLNTLKIIGMITYMSIMWALWNSKTINEWLFLMSNFNKLDENNLLTVFILLTILIAIGVLLYYLINLNFIQKLIQIKPSQTLFLTLPVITLLLVISNKRIQSILPIKVSKFIQTVSEDSPNKIDKKNAEIGYYDRLIEGDEDVTIGIGSKGFIKKLQKNPYTLAYYNTTNLLNRRMKPNLNIQGLDHNFLSNQFGIRDKAYSKNKKDSVYRMALLGGSYEMGSGVSNNQNFEYLTEERLNKNFPDSNFKSIEIWNFAAGGYYLIEHLELLNTEVFKYKPNAVIYFAHSDERNKMIKDITNILKRNVPIKYKFLNDIITLSGVKSYMAENQIKQLLNPYIDCILQWSYFEMATICKKNNAKIIWVYLLTTEENVNENEYSTILKFAKQAGYITLDLKNVYGNIPRNTIQISEINSHPNVLGHLLIANEFYYELLKHKQEIFNKK